MTEFRMPSLGADMDAGTLVEWLKHSGDTLRRGDIIAVVETQKGAIEIEVFTDGVLDEIRIQPGERVPVGQVLATILDNGKMDMPASKVDDVVVSPPSATTPEDIVSTTYVRPKITPAARRRATDLAIDPASLKPGKDGIIDLAEVEAAAGKPRALKVGRPDLDQMRKAIAAAMARSKREIPHYAVSSTFDMSALQHWLESENATRPIQKRLLYAVPLMKTVAIALRNAPKLNGHFVDGEYRQAERINIGVAISLRGGGLVAPAILDVDMLGLDDLMAKLRDLVGRVRGGRLKSSELSDATITLSNLGEKTADNIVPVIYPPQVAILGCGQIAERPWVSDGGVRVRPLMTMTVAGDHRVSDGLAAAQFLTRFGQTLGQPEEL